MNYFSKYKTKLSPPTPSQGETGNLSLENKIQPKIDILQLTVGMRGQRSVGQEKQDRRSARNVENNYCNYLDLGTNWKRASGLFVFSILTAGLSCQLAQNILSSVAL